MLEINASFADCSSIKNAKDILLCALQNHPDIKREKAALRQSESLEDQAEQRPNPEVDVQAFGQSLDSNKMNTQISIAHTVELGGKRGARIENATAQFENSGVHLQKAKEEVTQNTVSALYRLRQITQEIDVLNEALATFDKIQKQFKTRPKLSPDLQVSFGVFQLASGDYKLRKITLLQEQLNHEAYLKLATGLTILKISSHLPKRKEKWPDFSENIDTNKLTGSYMRSALVGLKLADAEYELEKSESWPSVKIGPAFQQTVDGPGQYNSFGAVLTFPLPLLNINGGGREIGFRGKQKAEINLGLRHQEINVERERLIESYKVTLQGLSTAVSITDIEKKHHNMEKLYYRGLVSAPLVIEAHRQIVDYTKNLNEQELKAVQTLWSLYILEGRLNEGEI